MLKFTGQRANHSDLPNLGPIFLHKRWCNYLCCIALILSLPRCCFLMSEQKAESPVSRGWSPTSFWDAILRLLPSKPPVNDRSFEFGPDALVCNSTSSIRSGLSNPLLQDQPRMDILHHLAASQPVTSHEADEPMLVAQ
jgi:hypothetical protein